MAPQTAKELPASSPAVEFRWPLYAASLFLPYAGIVIALFLIESDSRPSRLVGRTCLLTGFLAWVLLPAVLLLAMLLFLGLAVAGFLSEFLQPY